MTFARAFLIFKYTVYALLALNMLFYFINEPAYVGVDALGWVILLALAEWQSWKEAEDDLTPHELAIVIAVQVVCSILILFSWSKFYAEAQWLDFISASLWLVIVVLLFFDFSTNSVAKRRAHKWYNALKYILYGALVLIIVLLAALRDYFNFYDAVLWAICFFTIEMDLLKRMRSRWRRKLSP